MLIETTLPFSVEQLRTIITTPNIHVVVDYDNSKLTKHTGLIYLSNVNLSSPLIISTNEEQLFELIDCYVTLKTTLFVPNLTDMVAQLAVFAKSFFFSEQRVCQMELDALSPLTSQQMVAYFSDATRAENFRKMMDVLDNLMTYTLSHNTAFKQTYGEPEQLFEVVNDIDYTGFTFIHLLGNADFIYEYYTNVSPNMEMKYFTQQYDEYIYGGKSLFAILHEKQCPIIPIFDCFLNKSLTPQMIADALQETNLLVT